ncbi:aspartate/glutamate racemase family protein [Sphingobacterium griseoflavum]|uniref:Aspartate racemase n=1 Tax=Sphingobacterium griseoflavum TaxID=1474952 RepID=A0ABQ3HVL8_9SPHI|nr:amino acid racemase [Sphingobacterium griseoflavum]GHE28316.1 aspartate racemase [Sphingobacterium griseoflavum]
MIGIVGGVGPLAGLDIVRKVIDETIANTDRDQLPILLHSHPHRISNPTDYLLGKEAHNPAYAIVEIISELENAGATVVAIPSHTAHAKRVFEVIEQELERKNSAVKLVHLIEETALFIKRKYGHTRVGILAGTDLKNNGLYHHILASHHLEVIEPDEELQDKIHTAIHDSTYGIRAVSSPVSNRARSEIIESIAALKEKGAQSIILGDSSLPDAIPEKESDGLPIIDPIRILARALVSALAPSKLQDDVASSRL